LKDIERENASIKTEVLKLQANKEKDKNFIDTIESKLQDREKQLDLFKQELESYEQKKVSWENERDELNSQIAVLTEER
jgi:chromosome segregation ATPase